MTQNVTGSVTTAARPTGPRFFTGSFDHSVDIKHRLVLPASMLFGAAFLIGFRTRLAEGAYLGPLDGFLGLWPEDGFESVLSRWADGVSLGIVSDEAYEAFMAATFDGRGFVRVVVDKPYVERALQGLVRDRDLSRFVL